MNPKTSPAQSCVPHSLGVMLGLKDIKLQPTTAVLEETVNKVAKGGKSVL